ncbi:hypothetical protein FB384_001629 [Prauserella sediminis]|uniref:Uncharacterized protein n=1 Tax=Prauserella sediminis TaxID=577680 RepID=A0A839XS75_9PSEU|nr:hypothetical protein [Prauserella sediminis]
MNSRAIRADSPSMWRTPRAVSRGTSTRGRAPTSLSPLSRSLPSRSLPSRDRCRPTAQPARLPRPIIEVMGYSAAHSARHGQPRPPTTHRNRNLGVAPTIDLRAPGLAANSLPPRIRLLLVPADRGVAVRGVAAPRSGRAAPLRGPRGSRPTTPIRTPSTHSPTRHPAQGRSTLRPAAVGTPRPRLEGASPPCAVSVAPSSETPSSAALWPRAAARHRTRRHPLHGPHPLRFTWTGSSLRRMFGARLAGTPQLTSTRRDCPRTPPAALSAHPVSVSVRARLSIAVSCVGLLCGSLGAGLSVPGSVRGSGLTGRARESPGDGIARPADAETAMRRPARRDTDRSTCPSREALSDTTDTHTRRTARHHLRPPHPGQQDRTRRPPFRGAASRV